MRQRFECNQSDKRATLYLYGDIGAEFFDGIGSEEVALALEAVPSDMPIDVRINSLGGAIHEGVAIYNLLRERSAEVVTHVDGYAASIAALIFMAGDRRTMAQSSRLMVHDPWGGVEGGADDFRRYASQLDQAKDMLLGVFSDRTGQDREQVAEMMAAETWMLSPRAAELGFATEVRDAAAIAAYARTWDAFKNAPECLAAPQPTEGQSKRRKLAAESAKVSRAVERIDIGDAIANTFG